MIRKTFVTLLLTGALGTLVLGMVSYWKGIPANEIWINAADDRPRVRVALINGTLHAVHSAPRDQVTAGDGEVRFGPFYAKRVLVGSLRASGVGVPFWLVFAMLAIGPTAAFMRGPLRRRRRRKRGECIHCGYSLTGLTELRCPECGRPFTPHTAAVNHDGRESTE
jgi:hypothetical protein